MFWCSWCVFFLRPTQHVAFGYMATVRYLGLALRKALPASTPLFSRNVPRADSLPYDVTTIAEASALVQLRTAFDEAKTVARQSGGVSSTAADDVVKVGTKLEHLGLCYGVLIATRATEVLTPLADKALEDVVTHYLVPPPDVLASIRGAHAAVPLIGDVVHGRRPLRPFEALLLLLAVAEQRYSKQRVPPPLHAFVASLFNGLAMEEFAVVAASHDLQPFVGPFLNALKRKPITVVAMLNLYEACCVRQPPPVRAAVEDYIELWIPSGGVDDAGAVNRLLGRLLANAETGPGVHAQDSGVANSATVATLALRVLDVEGSRLHSDRAGVGMLRALGVAAAAVRNAGATHPAAGTVVLLGHVGEASPDDALMLPPLADVPALTLARLPRITEQRTHELPTTIGLLREFHPWVPSAHVAAFCMMGAEPPREPKPHMWRSLAAHPAFLRVPEPHRSATLSRVVDGAFATLDAPRSFHVRGVGSSAHLHSVVVDHRIDRGNSQGSASPAAATELLRLLRCLLQPDCAATAGVLLRSHHSASDRSNAVLMVRAAHRLSSYALAPRTGVLLLLLRHAGVRPQGGDDADGDATFPMRDVLRAAFAQPGAADDMARVVDEGLTIIEAVAAEHDPTNTESHSRTLQRRVHDASLALMFALAVASAHDVAGATLAVTAAMATRAWTALFGLFAPSRGSMSIAVSALTSLCDPKHVVLGSLHDIDPTTLGRLRTLLSPRAVPADAPPSSGSDDAAASPSSTVLAWPMAEHCDVAVLCGLARAWAAVDGVRGKAFVEACASAAIFGTLAPPMPGKPAPLPRREPLLKKLTQSKAQLPRLTQAAEDLFTALTMHGEWNTVLTVPLLRFVLGTVDVTPSSTVYRRILQEAAAHENEFKRAAVRDVVAKALEVLCDRAGDYADTEAYVELLGLVLSVTGAAHREQRRQLMQRLAGLPPERFARFVDHCNRLKVHVEEAFQRRLSQRLAVAAHGSACSAGDLVSLCHTVMVPHGITWGFFADRFDAALVGMGLSSDLFSVSNLDPSALASAARKACQDDQGGLSPAVTEAVIRYCTFKLAGSANVRKLCAAASHLIHWDHAPTQPVYEFWWTVLDAHAGSTSSAPAASPGRGGGQQQQQLPLLNLFTLMYRLRLLPLADAAAVGHPVDVTMPVSKAVNNAARLVCRHGWAAPGGPRRSSRRRRALRAGAAAPTAAAPLAGDAPSELARLAVATVDTGLVASVVNAFAIDLCDTGPKREAVDALATVVLAVVAHRAMAAVPLFPRMCFTLYARLMQEQLAAAATRAASLGTAGHAWGHGSPASQPAHALWRSAASENGRLMTRVAAAMRVVVNECPEYMAAIADRPEDGYGSHGEPPVRSFDGRARGVLLLHGLLHPEAARLGGADDVPPHRRPHRV